MDIKMVLNDGSTITCKREVQEIMLIKDGIEYDIKFLCSTPTLVVRKYVLDMVSTPTDDNINIEPSSPNTILLK